MKILITGHKGLIGSHIYTMLSRLGNYVKGIDIKTNFDLTRHKIPDEYYDMIIHCASYCRIKHCIDSPKTNFLNNVMATQNIFEYARNNRIKKIITFSSSRVLSKEENNYTAAKKFMENLAKAYQQCYGINYIIIRPSTVYGIGDSHDRIIPKFITNALRNLNLEIYGNKHKTLDITNINDFMRAFELILRADQWNKDYNIANETEVNITELAEFIIKETKSQSKIIYKKPETAQPQQVKVNIENLREIGYFERENWKQPLLKYIQYLALE